MSRASDPPEGPPSGAAPTVPAWEALRYDDPGEGWPELGRGGLGQVFLVGDRSLGRDVALKVLQEPGRTTASASDLGPSSDTFDLGSRLDGPGATLGFDLDGAPASALPPTPSNPDLPRSPAERRFLREARITAQLEHPSIVPIYELGRRQDGSLYYTMPRIRGGTLEAALRAAPDLAGRLALLPHFIDVCNAMAYAHSRGVLHRDLKPANVMVGEFGETLVLDWGLAKARDGPDVSLDQLAVGTQSGDATQVGVILGSPGWMSPEQARGELATLDARSDIWSLGAILFALLTGGPPFEAESAWETVRRTRTDAAPPVTTRAPDAPPALAAVAERALRREAAARYSDARALAAEVEAWQAGRRVDAYHYSPRELLLLWARQRRVPLAVAGAAALVLGASGAAFVHNLQVERDRAQAAERLADVRAQRASAVRAEIEGDPHAALALYRAAAELAPEPAERDRLARHADRLASTGLGSRVLTGHDRAVWSADWAADGRRLVTGSLDGTAKLWDPTTGAELWTSPDHEGRVSTPRFSPDGALLATWGANRAAGGLWSAADGAPVAALDVGQSEGVVGAWSPDGRRFAGTARDGSLRVWAAAGGALVSHLDLGAAVRRVAWSRDGRWLAAATNAPEVALISAADLAVAQRITVPSKPMSLAFSADGRALFTAGRPLLRIDLETGQTTPLEAGLVEHADDRAWLVRTAPDGSGLAVTWYGGRVSLHDADTGAWERDLLGPGSMAWDAAWSPDSALLAVASEDGPVRLVLPGTGHTLEVLRGHEASVEGLAWSGDGRRLATASSDGTARVWHVVAAPDLLAPDAAPRPPELEGFNHEGEVDGAELWFDPATASARLLDPATGEEVGRWSQPDLPRVFGRATAQWLGDRSALVVFGKPCEVAFAHPATGERLRSFSCGTTSIGHQLLVQHDRLVVSHADGTASLWALSSGEQVAPPRGDWVFASLSSTRTAAFDGGWISLSDTGDVMVWRAEDGSQIARVPARATVARGLPHGAGVVAVDQDGALTLWEPPWESGRPLGQVDGPVVRLVTDPTATWVAALHASGSTALWHIPAGRRVRTVSLDASELQIGEGGALTLGLRGAGTTAALPPPAALEALPTNYRVCPSTDRVVAVLPYPTDDSPWAPASACVP